MNEQATKSDKYNKKGGEKIPSPEKMEFNFGSWNNPEPTYLYGEIVRSKNFETFPYIMKYLFLIRLQDGYGYKEGQWGVVQEEKQEGHPQYSNGDKASIEVFESKSEAKKKYEKILDALRKEYPD